MPGESFGSGGVGRGWLLLWFVSAGWFGVESVDFRR